MSEQLWDDKRIIADVSSEKIYITDAIGRGHDVLEPLSVIRLCQQMRDEYEAELAKAQQAAGGEAKQVPQPDWSKAPDWANFHVFNCQGMGLWSEIHLEINPGSASGWRGVLLSTNAVFSGYQLPIGIDWRTTLQPRTEGGQL